MTAGPFEGHRHTVSSVSFSPDGHHIVSGSDDHTIRIWDLEANFNQVLLFISSSLFTPTSQMNEQGWVLGPNLELLFWVPPDLRLGLLWPNNTLVIGKCIKTKLDLSSFVHGESWAQCQGL
ncbi:hypothetical protein CPB86DRAFT_770742 [Serendipita vermifera]|nr:hypothetical protein CPB86DRAFT_770742 [Serendipita vermifera]